MSETSSYYIGKLREAYQQRLHKNPSYSLRAFSSYLGLAPQVLSLVFQGKRHLPTKKTPYVVEKLGLSPKEEKLFLGDLSSCKAKLSHLASNKSVDEETLSEERHFRIIAEWEYYAVLNLLDTKDLFTTVAQISERLGLKQKRIEFVIGELISEKMISRDSSGKFQREAKPLTTTRDLPSRALRIAHKEALQLASEKIEQVSIEKRFYSSSTISIDKMKIAAAKELMREFRMKMAHFMKEGDVDEVYQFNMQFFPLSNQSEGDH